MQGSYPCSNDLAILHALQLRVRCADDAMDCWTDKGVRHEGAFAEEWIHATGSKGFFALSLIGSCLLMQTTIARADFCPDDLQCYGPNPGAEQLRWVGSFGTGGSCWSWTWWTCAPWHCEGNNTSKQYWEDKCNSTFVGCQGKCKVRVEIGWSFTW